MSGHTGTTTDGRAAGPRCVAIVGPHGSGKTTLLEAILERTGAIPKAGNVAAGSSVGDRSKEARAHGMGIDLNAADAEFLGDRYTFLDCPGFVEFSFEMQPVLAVADVAVVVCEADEKKIPALQLVLRQLEAAGVPHVLFVNKIDKADATLRDTLKLMQSASTTPLVLRQIPIWKDGAAIGTIELALERALVYREHAESQEVPIPSDHQADELAARYEMLERLADYDDDLMEELLTDVAPDRSQIFQDLRKEMRSGQITPVFVGSAERGNGITRLMKALRHDAAGIEETRARLGLADGAEAIVQVAKTVQTSHAGKLSIVRVLSGKLTDGLALTAADGATGRVSGLYALGTGTPSKVPEAIAGSVVGIGKVDPAETGLTLSSGKTPPKELVPLVPPSPVISMVVAPKEAKDDVKLSTALGRLAEEDPSLVVVQDADTAETRIEGQGEMHLRVQLERLQNRFGVAVVTRDPVIPYRETIKSSITVRGRHKKQSGGHGQFGDCVLTIEPQGRGEGFAFAEVVTGGAVPKNYFPAIEEGVVESLKRGALGFPLVDVKVTLSDGSFHPVDSSDMAFKTAAGIGMREGLPQCSPVLLEPILRVKFYGPSEFTARINQIVTGRRGQLLGFDGREGWQGWDVTEALIPQAEMGMLIVELRSATAGVGTFEAAFDHLQEITGPVAQKVVDKRKTELAAA
ncbi:elongation factor G [Pleomorphomonas sp. NRK KF1]|uniref:elongation factor G n=1 Tax=Pleomorphomonas sp. NRK KF1 TaxID=2943000 RepID=UPI002043E37D|nr:elongation factor G [Pleomorphomonas sp. NRK KF1]MCM5551740.1 elongation factor G [Pleomorphomonas sp. NRK KF1]